MRKARVLLRPFEFSFAPHNFQPLRSSLCLLSFFLFIKNSSTFTTMNNEVERMQREASERFWSLLLVGIVIGGIGLGHQNFLDSVVVFASVLFAATSIHNNGANAATIVRTIVRNNDANAATIVTAITTARNARPGSPSTHSSGRDVKHARLHEAPCGLLHAALGSDGSTMA